MTTQINKFAIYNSNQRAISELVKSMNELRTTMVSSYKTPQFMEFVKRINLIQSDIFSSTVIIGKMMANINPPIQELVQSLSRMSDIAKTVSSIRIPDFYADYKKYVSETFIDINSNIQINGNNPESNEDISEDVLDQLNEKIAKIKQDQQELVTKDDLQNFINDTYKAGIKQIDNTASLSVKQKLFSALFQVIIGIIIFFCTQPFASIFNGDKPSVQNNYYSKTVIIKQEKKAVASSNIPRELIRDYRIVIHKTSVFSSRSIKSKVQYNLPIGSAVQVVIKKRNWSLVKYRTDQFYEIGWTLTRYIKHFEQIFI